MSSLYADLMPWSFWALRRIFCVLRVKVTAQTSRVSNIREPCLRDLRDKRNWIFNGGWGLNFALLRDYLTA